ncbi:hypothetical protein BGZ98_002830 [Dissophora globulifera]|nr:hypothetical protein BGZ98_002830 [Dissophora globulifera]
MAPFETRVARSWPRFYVGSYSFFSLLSDALLIFIIVHINTLNVGPAFLAMTSTAAFMDTSSSSFSPDGAVKVILTVLVIFFTLSDLVAFHAAVSNSITTTKISLGFWLLRTALTVVIFVATVVGIIVHGPFFGNSYIDPQSNQSSFWTSLALHFLYGWSLFVMLRDQRGERRDRWGFLVESQEKGVFDEEPTHGPIRLSV